MIGHKSKIFVAGHNGLVGSAILRQLKLKGYKNLLTINRKNLDLRNQEKVYKFLKKNKPKFIFLAAAKVGGILSNKIKKADFITENLLIQTNVINGAFLSGVKNLIFLGSSCVYPRTSKLRVQVQAKPILPCPRPAGSTQTETNTKIKTKLR